MVLGFYFVVFSFFFPKLLSSVLERAGRVIFNRKGTRKLRALCYSSLSVSSTEQNDIACIIWEHAEAADRFEWRFLVFPGN